MKSPLQVPSLFREPPGGAKVGKEEGEKLFERSESYFKKLINSQVRTAKAQKPFLNAPLQVPGLFREPPGGAKIGKEEGEKLFERSEFFSPPFRPQRLRLPKLSLDFLAPPF